MGAYTNINALITGANRGLGYGFVKHLLKRPIRNIFAGVRNFEKAKELKHIAKEDPRLMLVQLDVTSDSSIKDAFSQVQERVGNDGLSLLINNSGVLSDKSSIEEPSREKMLEVFNINTVGPIIITAKFLPLLQKAATLERPSKIINMSSIAGSIENIPEQKFWMKNPTYSMSKAALNAYTKFFGFSDHYTNIITVSIHPGWVNTHSDEAELSVDESVTSMLETIGRLKRKHSSNFIDQHGAGLPH